MLLIGNRIYKYYFSFKNLFCEIFNNYLDENTAVYYAINMKKKLSNHICYQLFNL